MHSDNVKRSVKASSAISFKRPELLLSSVIFFRSFQVFEWSPKPLFWDDLSKNLEISLVNDMIIFLSTTTIYLSWSEIVTFLTSKQVLPLRKHIQKKKKKKKWWMRFLKFSSVFLSPGGFTLFLGITKSVFYMNYA